MLFISGAKTEAAGKNRVKEAFAFRQGRSRETSYARDYDRLVELLRHERKRQEGHYQRENYLSHHFSVLLNGPSSAVGFSSTGLVSSTK